MRESYSLIYLTTWPKKMIWLSTEKMTLLKCLKKTLYRLSLFMTTPILSDSNSKIKKQKKKKLLLSDLLTNKQLFSNTRAGKSRNAMTWLTGLLNMHPHLNLNLNLSQTGHPKVTSLSKDSRELQELPDSKSKKTILLEPTMKNIKMMKMKTSFEGKQY